MEPSSRQALPGHWMGRHPDGERVELGTEHALLAICQGLIPNLVAALRGEIDVANYAGAALAIDEFQIKVARSNALKDESFFVVERLVPVV